MSISSVINDSLKDNLLYLDDSSNALINQLTEIYIIHNKDPTEEESKKWQNISNTILTSLNQIKILTNIESSNHSINLKEVEKILKPFSKGSLIKNEVKCQEFKLIKKLENHIILYGIVAIYQIYAIGLLKSTIPLDDQYYYYDLISNSNWKLALYSLQILPLNVNSLLKKIYKDFFENIKSSSFDYKFYKDSLFNSVYKNVLTSTNFNNSLTINNIGLLNYKSFYKKPMSYIYFIIRAPFISFINKIEETKKSIENHKILNATKLGSLLTNLPNFKDCDNKSLTKFILETLDEKIDLIDDELSMLYKLSHQIIPKVLKEDKMETKRLSKPSILTRYWPSLLISLLYGPSTVLSIISSRDQIVDFFQKNLINTMVGFYENWIIEPINNILNTIRHDDNYSEISIASQNSLDSDLNSLKRMVIDYIVDNPDSIKQSGVLSTNEIESLITKGDLTPIMKDYEVAIKTPLKSLVVGNLPRNLMIQVQKGKVDGCLAISGIDKMLKSQELVFGFIAASPSLIIVFYLTSLIKNYWIYQGEVWKDIKTHKLITSKNMNNIERLLIIDEEDIDLINGLLLIEVISLRNQGLQILPNNRKSEWIRDINDLLNSKSTRMKTLHRMYNAYGRFL